MADLTQLLGMDDVSEVTGQSKTEERNNYVEIQPTYLEGVGAAFEAATTVVDVWARGSAREEAEALAKANNEDKVSAQDLNEQFAGLQERFTDDQYYSVAFQVAEDQHEKNLQNSAASRAGWGAGFIGGALAHMTDPVEFTAGVAAAIALPMAGAAFATGRYGTMLGRMGAMMGNFPLTTQLVGDMLGNAAVEPILYSGAKESQETYTYSDVLQSVFVAPLLGMAVIKGLPASVKLGGKVTSKAWNKSLQWMNSGKLLDFDALAKVPQGDVTIKAGKAHVVVDNSVLSDKGMGVRTLTDDITRAKNVAGHPLRDIPTKTAEVDVSKLNIADEAKTSTRLDEIDKMDTTVAEKAALREEFAKDLAGEGFDGVKFANKDGSTSFELFETKATKEALDNAIPQDVVAREASPEMEAPATREADMYYDADIEASFRNASADATKNYDPKVPPEMTARETDALERLKTLGEEGRLDTNKLDDFRSEIVSDTKAAEDIDEALKSAIFCMRG